MAIKYSWTRLESKTILNRWNKEINYDIEKNKLQINYIKYEEDEYDYIFESFDDDQVFLDNIRIEYKKEEKTEIKKVNSESNDEKLKIPTQWKLKII